MLSSYYFYRIAQIICELLPRRLTYFIAEIIALLFFYLNKKSRKNVAYDIGPFITESKDLDKAVYNVFRNFSYYLVDFLGYRRLTSDFINKYVKIENRHYLDSVLNEGNGTIIYTAHLGSWELGGAIFSMLGYKIYAVVLTLKDKRLYTFFQKQREFFGIHPLPLNNAAKSCYNLLKKGKMVVLVGDKDFSNSGVLVKMGKKEAIIPKGAAFLACRSGCKIVPGFFLRDKKYYYRMVFEQPISPFRKDGTKKKVEELINECADILARYIEKYFEQWYIFDRYWVNG